MRCKNKNKAQLESHYGTNLKLTTYILYKLQCAELTQLTSLFQIIKR